MKVRHWLYFIGSLLGVWYCFSILINNSFILPYPNEVALSMIDFLKTDVFYISVFMTMLRAVASILVSFIFASIISLISLKRSVFASFFDKLVLILRSIPNVTYVILLLFWLSREISVFVVSFLLLFPIIYQNLYEALKSLDSEWKDVLKIYPQDLFVTYTKIYFPLMKPAIVASFVTASSLAFKVGIMAEILGQVQTGIGRQIQLARLDINLTDVIAWTIWLVICVFIFDWLIKKILTLIVR